MSTTVTVVATCSYRVKIMLLWLVGYKYHRPASSKISSTHCIFCRI